MLRFRRTLATCMQATATMYGACSKHRCVLYESFRTALSFASSVVSTRTDKPDAAVVPSQVESNLIEMSFAYR